VATEVNEILSDRRQRQDVKVYRRFGHCELVHETQGNLHI